MALSKYERGNTIKSDIDFLMNGVLTDPSGNTAFVDVIKSDGTYLVQGQTATRDGVGEYHTFFKAENDDPLGVYVIVWYGSHNIGGSYGYMGLVQRDAIQIVDVDQE